MAIEKQMGQLLNDIDVEMEAPKERRGVGSSSCGSEYALGQVTKRGLNFV